MRSVFIVLALFAFIAGGLADVAHAATPNAGCSQQAGDKETSSEHCGKKQTQDKAGCEQCQSCCCHHTHMITKIVPDSAVQFIFKTASGIEPDRTLRSLTPPPLHRPPIA